MRMWCLNEIEKEIMSLTRCFVIQSGIWEFAGRSNTIPHSLVDNLRVRPLGQGFSKWPTSYWSCNRMPLDLLVEENAHSQTVEYEFATLNLQYKAPQCDSHPVSYWIRSNDRTVWRQVQSHLLPVDHEISYEETGTTNDHSPPVSHMVI